MEAIGNIIWMIIMFIMFVIGILSFAFLVGFIIFTLYEHIVERIPEDEDFPGEGL